MTLKIGQKGAIGRNMEAKIKQAIWKEINTKYPGTYEDDVDWEIGEIFFGAGCKQGIEDQNEAILRTAEATHQAGMQEVVEWLWRCKKIKVPKYQLKEWGIEEV